METKGQDRKTKILVVAPTPFFSDRGTHIRILEEALALEKIGHEITIATYHIGHEIDREIKTAIKVRRILRLLFWYKKIEAGPDWQKIILDLMLIRKTFNLARTEHPDIIHGHLHEGVLIGWIVQKALFWRKIRLVADFHGSLTQEMLSHGYLSHDWLKAIFIWIEKIIDNLGDAVITSSWENTDEIRSLRQDGIVETVLDGVNLDRYEALPGKSVSRRELELPTDRPVIVYTGALLGNKGIKDLFDAIIEVLKIRKDAYFVLAGFPAEDAESFIQKNSFEKDVRLISPLKYLDLPGLLNACDVAIDPKDSQTRQASGKILQYMGAGLPVVCFDRQNNREYLEDFGLYAAAPDASGLAERILAAISDLPSANEKGRLGKLRAKNFSWEESARKIDAIYHKLKL